MQNSILDSPENNPPKAIPNLLPVGALVFMLLLTVSHIILKLFDIIWVVLPMNPYASLIIGHATSLVIACFFGMRISRKIWADIDHGVAKSKTLITRYSIYLIASLVFQYVSGYVSMIIIVALSKEGPSGFWAIMSYETLIAPLKPFILVIEMALLIFALTRRR